MNPANSQEALTQLQQAQNTAQDPNSILNAQRQQLGVNAAQDTVTGLRGAIDNTTKLLKQVAPSVMGRTQNSLVTNAQANRQIANESAPISQTLQDQSGKYNDANQNLDRLGSLASETAGNIYKGQQDKISYAQNLYNALYGREQDVQAQREREQARQDSIAQANVKASSSSTKASKADVSSSADQVNSYLSSKKGRDGYVSPYDYNAMKSAWAQDGLPIDSFNAIFGKYKNPKTKGYQ